MSISVEEYNRVERLAIENIDSSQLIEAFFPVTFGNTGYPIRISKEKELVRYVDVMHSLRFENDFRSLMNGSLTDDEFSLLRELTILICQFCESNFGRKMIARASVLRMLNVLRHIKYIFGTARPSIFEVGPGCGYLGALSILSGYPYGGTDVTQAFYIYQNHLWDFISDNNLIELAYGESSKKFQAPSSNCPIHIPWWKFSTLKSGEIPKFDVVTANHVLCEMNRDSLRLSLRIAKEMLRGDGLKLFIFEGWGEEAPTVETKHRSGISTAKQVFNDFDKVGFELVHNDNYITVFEPSQRINNNQSNKVKSVSGVTGNRLFENIEKTKSKREPVYYNNDEKYIIVKKLFRKLVGQLYHNVKEVYFDQKYIQNSPNSISRNIIDKRKLLLKKGGKKIDEVNKFYLDLLDNESILNPDELFFLESLRKSF